MMFISKHIIINLELYYFKLLINIFIKKNILRYSFVRKFFIRIIKNVFHNLNFIFYGYKITFVFKFNFNINQYYKITKLKFNIFFLELKFLLNKIVLFLI